MKKPLLTLYTLLFALLLLRPSFHGAWAQSGRFYPSDRLSSSMVTTICQDRYGYIWIGTDYGLNRFDGYRFTSYQALEGDTTGLYTSVISHLFCDRDGELWVGTGRGLCRYDYRRNAFVRYDVPGDMRPRISDIEQLSDGRLLIATAGYGIYQLRPGARSVESLEGYATERTGNFFSRILVDSRGNFWKTGHDDVVVRRDGRTGKLTELTSPLGTPSGLFELGGQVYVLCPHGILQVRGGQLVDAAFEMSEQARAAVLRVALCDARGNVFIGTRGSGVFRIAKGSRRMEQVEYQSNAFDLNNSKIWALMVDREQNLWVGCQQKGLLMLPNRQEPFRSWSFSAQNVRLGTAVSSLCEGSDGMTWCTVQGNGVYGFSSEGRVVAHPKSPHGAECIYRDQEGAFWLGTDDGLYSYSPLTGASQLVARYGCDMINDMTDDGQGNIYLSTFSKGFCVYNKQTRQLRHFSELTRLTDDNRLCNRWIMCMMPDRNGMIWFGTASGVSCFDPHKMCFNALGWTELLSGQSCFSVCETREGDIVMGTDNGLYVWRRKSNKVEPFPDAEPLKNKVTAYIVEDNEGDLWCSTSDGIWQYQRNSRRFVGYLAGGGLSLREYVNNVGIHTDDNRILFGNSDGLTAFVPADVKKLHHTVSEVKMVRMTVTGRTVGTDTESDGEPITDKAVEESHSFEVSYLDNDLTVDFSLLNYANPDNVTFEYRLNGGAWMPQPEGSNSFSFNHLAPGTYQLDVRATEGGAYSPVSSYTLKVRGPWYSSPVAFVVYFLLLAGLATLVLTTYLRRRRAQLDEEKMKFLINATHDIRSPLTLIMGPLHKLKKRLTDDDSRRDVDTIERNANRILNLVSQILDVRKIDKQQMHLHCQEVNLGKFVEGVCKVFEYNAQERGITFTFEQPEQPVSVWVDATQFDKVVTNLLSNAFKYCHDNGAIAVRVAADGQQAVLTVKDDGVGLGSDGGKRIFDRFYQGGNSRSLHIEGTGIGLNLRKMIVDMHHGAIEAANNTDGPGSIFTVHIPLGNSHLSAEETQRSVDTGAVAVPEAKKQQSRTTIRVLIVDDDPELGRYISSELGRYYHFTTCANGKEGLKELLTNNYDCVVSDVMMPEMDGFTLLRMIKTNINVSHIPVIMLTSQADVGNRLEGLERGADAFIAKPFNMEELHMSIDNVINNVRRLKGKFSGAQIPTALIEDPEVKGNDELLMERIIKVVNKNLGNSDFNVDMLTAEVGISRAQLHRKMKDMTGIPASEFIRNIRLEQAARLLKEQKINITQVAYTVGFSNLAHFSTVFRKHFGISPKEYVDQEDQEAS